MSKQVFSIIGVLLWSWNLLSQSTIAYTVDPDFDAGQNIRSKTSVFDIYPLEDGGYFLGGGFNTLSFNPDSPFLFGLAMVTNNGNAHPDWGNGAAGFARELFDHEGGYLLSNTESITKITYSGDTWSIVNNEIWGEYFQWVENGVPLYDVRWAWDLFILEDQSVLIGGAIVTDTLQPGVFRHLMRLMADGSHDADFPIIEAMPQGLNTHISKIERASDGTWYVSGRFEGINGHITPHVAHLTADFEVDTDYTSPLVFQSRCCGLHNEMKLLDSQDRIWIGGEIIRLASNPSDSLQLVRLLSDGSVDESFELGKADAREWEDFGTEGPPFIQGVIEHPNGDFFIHGKFSHYNDTQQYCITALNDAGLIQSNYFGGQGATINYYNPTDPDAFSRPDAFAMELLPDGNLMVGGAFSDFMGQEKYSIVRLIQGTVSSEGQDRFDRVLRVFPNPASGSIRVTVQPSPEASADRHFGSSVVNILDLSGRVVASYPWRNEGQYDISGLAKGVYLVELRSDEGVLGVEKVVKE